MDIKRIEEIINKLEEELEECCEITCDRDSCLSLIDELKKELGDE
jgi:hypothetical protein